ncbi:MAG TPA: trypsin-like peptidase domain-containing protein [Candidatus Saccharimonadales bacterium]|nr:trypsin-like peptidase domain-containing protein [Candidatus Saccharimonadales bacterium]
MPVIRIRPHSVTPAFLALLALVALAPHAPAASILPLRSEEATLLIGVDSARTSVVTMVALPGKETRPRAGQPVRRLIGTAVVLSPYRVLTTASMAISGGRFNVLLGDGLKREARVRGVDRQSNVALFSIEGSPLTPLRQASPQSIAAGSWVAVISNVNVTRPQISLGQVLGRGERVDFPYSGDIVEIESSAYPGTSGGAVLNELGEWVALVVGRASPSSDRGATAPVGAPDPEPRKEPGDILIALPIDQIQHIAEDLEQFGSVRRAFLGIQMRRGVLAESLGVVVEGVVPDSPAAKAGVKVGDRILAMEGTPVHTSEEITSLVRTMRPGDELEMTLSRSADIFPVHAVLEGAVSVPSMPHPSPRDEELEQLKKNLHKLESETKKVEGRIKELEGPPPR